MKKYLLIVIALPGLLFYCTPDSRKGSKEEKAEIFNIEKAYFGTTPGGDSIFQYTLSNYSMEIRVINYGGIITHLKVPDRDGKVADIVLGYDHLEDYLAGSPYFGAIVGRYGNRIAGGTFSLNGNTYELAVNNGDNHLHGGIIGFDKVVWQAKQFADDEEAGIVLSYLSKDMEEGYPGNLNVSVKYAIKKNNEFEINYHAVTDQPTVINLTQHSYFNLSGNTQRDILDHLVMIKADEILPVDAGLIPTGSMMPVEKTPFDFKTLTRVGERIHQDDEQLKLGGGYDHCWVLSKTNPDALEWVVKAVDPGSGRTFELATTEPGVQFYSGNFLDGTLTGKYNVTYEQRYGMCFEPEHFPDSPNQPAFPSVVLNPGEEYTSTTVWKFDIAE